MKMKTIHIILLIFSVVSFTCITYILYQINTNPVEALNINKSKFDALDYFMGFGHLFILLFHFYAIFYIFSHFRHFSEYKKIRIILLTLGVISLFAIGGEKIMIDEIAKEYQPGFGINELYILNIEYIINMAFVILLFFYVLITFRLGHINSLKSIFVDEIIFTIAQCLGIVAGLMGLLFTFHFIVFVRKQVPDEKLWVLIPFYMLFLIPYGLTILYWLFLKQGQHIKDWYDEKQLQDILKSSLTTMLLSFPGLAFILLIKIPSTFYIFPYYLFFVLLIFSSSTLYFNKIKDIG